MSEKKSSRGASVTARLLNRAKQKSDDYPTLLEGSCFERFLYRLSASSVRSRFVLKDAMLLRPGSAWLVSESAKEYIRTRFPVMPTASNAAAR